MAVADFVGLTLDVCEGVTVGVRDELVLVVGDEEREELAVILVENEAEALTDIELVTLELSVRVVRGDADGEIEVNADFETSGDAESRAEPETETVETGLVPEGEIVMRAVTVGVDSVEYDAQEALALSDAIEPVAEPLGSADELAEPVSEKAALKELVKSEDSDWETLVVPVGEDFADFEAD